MKGHIKCQNNDEFFQMLVRSVMEVVYESKFHNGSTRVRVGFSWSRSCTAVHERDIFSHDSCEDAI